jgi:collagen type VI alpha
VFALDQSSDVTEQRFNETRDIIISTVNDLNIRENNCPVGARVVVVSYDSDTSYLIRSSDYRNKKELLQLLSQIKYQVPMEAQDIGRAMRFVAHSVFKRTLAGANVRRVAVFFSNGQAASRSSILMATMEFSALDIIPAVFAFNERVFFDEAFGVRISLDNFVIFKYWYGKDGSGGELGRCVTLILCSFAGLLLSVTMKSNTL